METILAMLLTLCVQTNMKRVEELPTNLQLEYADFVVNRCLATNKPLTQLICYQGDRQICGLLK